MKKGNELVSFEKVEDFVSRLQSCGNGRIFCTDHTFFRLDESQRQIYTCERLKEYLLTDTPVRVGVQADGCYAAFYKLNKGLFIRIIVSQKADKATIVTFYIIEERQVPRGIL